MNAYVCYFKNFVVEFFRESKNDIYVDQRWSYEEAFIKIAKIQSVSDRTSPCIGTWRPLSLLQIHKSIFCLVSVRN